MYIYDKLIPISDTYNISFQIYCLLKYLAFIIIMNHIKTCVFEYRKISNTRRTKSQNLNDSRLVLQLYLPNQLKPGVKSRMQM